MNLWLQARILGHEHTKIAALLVIISLILTKMDFAWVNKNLVTFSECMFRESVIFSLKCNKKVILVIEKD